MKQYFEMEGGNNNWNRKEIVLLEKFKKNVGKIKVKLEILKLNT